MDKSRKLVAYFSASGVTKKLAETLADAVGADIYEISPKIPYTAADLDWTNKKSRSTLEMNDKNSRPEIAGALPDTAKYDVVFVGFPIWWYVAPTIIDTFLEGCGLAGKTVIPFATSGGSGMGGTEKILRGVCPDSVDWRPGKRFSGGASASELKAWSEGLGIR